MSLISVPRSPASAGAPRQGDRTHPRLQKRDSFLMVQGSALLLPEAEVEDSSSNENKPFVAGYSLQQDLEQMCQLLRPQESISLAIRLECTEQYRHRYFLLVSNTENRAENIILGTDIVSHKRWRDCTIGLVFPIWSDTHVFLDGDGGFSVTSSGHTCIFKPYNVQAMWTVLQALYACCQEAHNQNLFPTSGYLSWSNHYNNQIRSTQECINDWHAMSDLLSTRSDIVVNTETPSALERTEDEIRSQLRNVMMDLDLETVTSKEIRTLVEQRMGRDLKEFRGFLDNEMLLILAQMDKPSQIFEFLYLGSEWNASNLPELEDNGVEYILNVTREIDNFFPGRFQYLNIRVYDEVETQLLPHWEETFRFISTARAQGSRCLVHCKMGVSRSASTVIAFAMKAHGWSLERTLDYVKRRRKVVKPNSGFLSQLRTYQGIIEASKQRHNMLWGTQPDTEVMPTTEDQPAGSQDDSTAKTRPQSPSPGPDSPSALSPGPNFRSALSPGPDSPSALSPRPQSPSALSPGPDSPSALSPRPQSTSALSPRPQSTSALSPRPQSTSALSPRPQSTSALSPRPQSPSALPPGPDSAFALSTRPQSPSALSPGPDSAFALSTRPQSPSAMSPMLESPSALSSRPQSPSALSPRPESPSALSPRPESPSALSQRPQSPFALSTRPQSPSAMSHRPESPSALSPRPQSPSALSPRPESPSSVSPRPQSPSALSPRPLPPITFPPRPQSPSALSPRPESPSALSPRPGKLRPALRSASVSHSRIDLLSVMRQVKEMEREEEEVAGRAQGWRRARSRAFSFQGPLPRVLSSMREEDTLLSPPGQDGDLRRRRSLRHSDALDLMEGEEVAEEE